MLKILLLLINLSLALSISSNDSLDIKFKNMIQNIKNIKNSNLKKEINLYNECVEFVNDIEKYRNNISDYSNYLQSYCKSVGATFARNNQNWCKVIIKYIINEIKNEFLPEYLNVEICEMFK